MVASRVLLIAYLLLAASAVHAAEKPGQQQPVHKTGCGNLTIIAVAKDPRAELELGDYQPCPEGQICVHPTGQAARCVPFTRKENWQCNGSYVVNYPNNLREQTLFGDFGTLYNAGIISTGMSSSSDDLTTNFFQNGNLGGPGNNGSKVSESHTDARYNISGQPNFQDLTHRLDYGFPNQPDIPNSQDPGRSHLQGPFAQMPGSSAMCTSMIQFANLVQAGCVQYTAQNGNNPEKWEWNCQGGSAWCNHDGAPNPCDFELRGSLTHSVTNQ